ncbi:PREDICTED: mitogen-activated protein kinase kinase kinase 1-like isoform X2 [Nelumbo nucifera]|uniref:mitogen-activated protein kinase kinase kinase n=2 Tax=Nelumbo nucifera TaxID=4432 RepID=A0A1U7ZFQ1_NELNU|nr:PREDICTED: mitogen-activated protein kinase kinase kinase 1-like isoform X2 [Nelumbo nucifera]
MHHLPRFLSHRKDETMDGGSSRRRPKLERRNAVKNIDYDAFSPSSSSPPGDLSPSLRATRSLEIFSITNKTSFRIEGADEVNEICRSLGLSGPEDFAIPTAAWEARKARSSSDIFPRPRLTHLVEDRDDIQEEPAEAEEEGEDGSWIGLSYRERITGEAAKQSAEDQRFPSVSPRGVEEEEWEGSLSTRSSDKFRVSDGAAERPTGDRSSSPPLFSDGNSLAPGSSGAGVGGGIKGVRPPVLAPPPAMLLKVEDRMGSASTWELLKSFAPKDDIVPSSSIRRVETGYSSSSDVDDDEEDRIREDGHEVIEAREEERVTGEQAKRLSDTSGLFESSWFSTSNDDDSSSTTTEPTNISPTLRVRRTITSWQRGGLLGSGSFGTVYEGIADDGFFFAVKEVSLLDQGSQGQQSVFQLEQDETKLYIFLELATQGSLANLYRKYRLGDSQVSAYTRQILNGLKYLHDQNVVHRDIKCTNILVDVSGSVKLADFGLAKATRMNDVKSCKGTAFWMAPEVVKSSGYGLPADIWSLGCTVLEMLTGQLPYSSLEWMQALFRIGRGILPPVPDTLSMDARNFIFECLKVNPNDRPTASQLLEHPFVKRPLLASSVPASPMHPNARRS